MIKIQIDEKKQNIEYGGNLADILTELAISTLSIFEGIEEQREKIKAIDITKMYIEALENGFDI